MKTIKLLYPILIIFLLQACVSHQQWYRGNTHAHTVICGHADSSPETVTNWYHENGYNFLILSEHNHFINPDSVTMPVDKRDDFILIPGEEISGPRIVHTTAMNTKKLVLPNKLLEIKSEILQDHIDQTLDAGGNTILNHPNYEFTISAEDVLPVTNLYLFELYNGHPLVKNEGDESHPSTEELWDTLLSSGMIIYGVSSDDAHTFAKIDSQYSNPGRGWVMVRAPELSPGIISQALRDGFFYASNGVILKKYSPSSKKYQIEVDNELTLNELAAPDLRGKRVDETEAGCFIEFVGSEGMVLARHKAAKAAFKVEPSTAYVRVKITYRRKHPEHGMEEFYAWGQPVFTDGRIDTYHAEFSHK